MAEVANWQPPAAGRKAGIGAGSAKPARSPLPLVAGVAALALLAGGGFYAWTTLGPAQTSQSARAPSDPPPLSEQPSTAPTTESAANLSPVLTEPRAPAASATLPPPAPSPSNAAEAPAAPPLAPSSQTAPAAPPAQMPSRPAAGQIATAVEIPAPAPPTAVEIPVAQPRQPEPPATAMLQQPSPPARQPALNTEPEPRTPTERIERYIRDYEGGPCFFLWPIEIGERRATLEGFGSTSAPFVAFDNAFKAAQGFEAQINLRPVTAAQCPMVEFLRRPGVGIDRSPRVQIGAFNMKSGDILNGSVEAGGGLNLDVVLIGDDGLVYNLESFMKREGGKVIFNLKLESTGGAARPQAVLALVSQEPLPTLSGPNPAPASEFFANLKLDLARQTAPLGLGIKYFRIE